MSLAIVYARAIQGITAPLVTVEVHLSAGLPQFNLVGLPKEAVKESKHRVRSALINACFNFPICRVTVNLAPADLPKEGGRFDLPIALGILAASKQLALDTLQQYEFIGELALSGALLPVKGILPIIITATADTPCRQLVIPAQNAGEAALVQKTPIYYAKHLLEIVAHLSGTASLPCCTQTTATPATDIILDLQDVKGQPQAKRALEIAAAGYHSLLLIGPPGTGKTMLASRLPDILPPLTTEDALTVATIASISQQGFDAALWKRVPFRAPHHTISTAALIGGGRPPKPGEISLAHAGVLFLDELPEFQRPALEALREPLELGKVAISRATFQVTFPARFQLVGAMNPCACGYYGAVPARCNCSPEQIKRYLYKISGPLLDRIDMHVSLYPLTNEILAMTTPSETSETIRQRIIAAHHVQQAQQNKYNALLTVAELNQLALSSAVHRLLKHMMDKLALSARAYHRMIKIALTIANLAGTQTIAEDHISEALQYRCLDRLR